MYSTADRSNDVHNQTRPMSLDLNHFRDLQEKGYSPNCDNMKNILALGQNNDYSAAAFLLSPGGSFAANLKVTHQTATTPQTPMSFLHPGVIPAEAELFAREFEKAKGQLFVKRELEEQLQQCGNQPISEMMDISYSTALGQSNTDSSSGNVNQQTPISGTVPLLMQAHSGCASPALPPSLSDMLNSNATFSGNVANDSYYHYEPRSVGGNSSCGENSSGLDGASPALSLVNGLTMCGNQDGLKLERKRARNRDAARKCRQRKLDRIGQLEEKVSDLKETNAKLSQSSIDLRKQVTDLKEMILRHVQMGCEMHEPNS